MPEGDTIHHAAGRIRAALVDAEIVSIETPQARHRMDRWPARLAGRRVRAVDAHGKHLFLRFEGDLTLHSHLRMRGRWDVYRRGERWRRAAARAWLVMRTEACFAAGVDPWRVVAQVSDTDALRIVREARTRMLDSVERGSQALDRWVFELTGLPCRRCGRPIRARGQGEDNRTTYWCPGCQR
jgi:formamidopyrimidine-DNA glycosylase